jgi:hypothetical protein
MKKFKIILIFSLAITFLMPSCGDFLDINVDPNNPSEPVLTNLMPVVQYNFATRYGMAGLSGTASLFMGQNVVRGALNDYGITGDNFAVTTNWNNFYTMLTNTNIIIENSLEADDLSMAGAAQIIKAFSFSILVDIWGNVPFFEANRGFEIPSPSYDNGAVIYEEIFALLDEAIANLEEGGPSPVLSASDLYYGGSTVQWIKLAKSLKLRLYNQIRGVQDVSAQINALVADPTSLINNMSDDFQFQYGASIAPENRNPSYAGQYAPGTRTNINPFFYEYMRGQNTFFPQPGNRLQGIEDPRIPYYFFNQLLPGEAPENPTAYHNTSTGFLSIYQFSFNIDPNEGFDQARSATGMGLYPIGGRYDAGVTDIEEPGQKTRINFNGAGDTPQRILCDYSMKFIRAELALEGVTGEDDESLFVMGIQAAFNKVNAIAAAASVPAIPQGDIEDYIDDVVTLYQAGDNEEKLELIMIQKWIANYGAGLESYNDYRRTGFPQLHDADTDNLTVTVRGFDYPRSWPYPDNSIQVNLNAPAQRRPAIDRVFWDAN